MVLKEFLASITELTAPVPLVTVFTFISAALADQSTSENAVLVKTNLNNNVLSTILAESVLI